MDVHGHKKLRFFWVSISLLFPLHTTLDLGTQKMTFKSATLGKYQMASDTEL